MIIVDKIKQLDDKITMFIIYIMITPIALLFDYLHFGEGETPEL